MTTRTLSFVALLCLAGCTCNPVPAGGDGGPDAGDDAGTYVDAGPSFDSCDGGALGAGTVAATGLDLPRRIAMDNEAVYLSVAGALTTYDGQVLRYDLDGGAVSTLASGFQAPDGIAVDDAFVYVIDRDGLWSIAKADGTKLAIDSNLAYITGNISGYTDVRASAGRVVVATGLGALVGERSDGGSRVVLYEGPTGTLVRGAAIEGSTVYFIVSGAPLSGLFKVGLDGTPAATQLSAAASEARSLAVTSKGFFWTEGSGGAGRVMMLDRGLSSGAVVLASGLNGPLRPVQAGMFVYFKDFTSSASDKFFRRVALCAPGTSEVVGPVGVGPGDVLFDGAQLWFTSTPTTPDGTLSHLP
jgi:hypothetical protein